MNLNVNNKYALVCGSTAGIGKATAFALAEEGAIVTLIARNEIKLKATLAELPQHRKHDYIVADFSNPMELKEKVEVKVKKVVEAALEKGVKVEAIDKNLEVDLKVAALTCRGLRSMHSSWSWQGLY